MNRSESKYFNTAVKMDTALISLLQKKPFEYISVREICETAGVNRSTFYLHYETIGDLLNETVRYLLDDFLSYFSIRLVDLSECKNKDLFFICNEYLVPYLTYIRDRKEIFKTAVLNNKTFGFEAVYKKMFDNIFDPVLERFDYPPKDRQYVMMYYLNGISAIVFEWLKNGCDKTCEELAEIIKVCVYGKERPNE